MDNVVNSIYSQVSAVNKNNTPWTKFQKDAMLYILTDIFLKSKILKKDSIFCLMPRKKLVVSSGAP
jgi:hypothetical protein